MTNKKHNYDWDAMGFAPDEDGFIAAFTWSATPQGFDWWNDNEFTPEGQAEFERMKRLYAEDMAAKEGPVRTVTRKEIVPGVYGCVSVSHAWPKLAVALIDPNVKADHIGHANLTKAELTDAIETLTQIRDAM